MNETSPTTILTFNTNLYQKTKTAIKMSGVLWTANVVRKSRDESRLYIRTGSREITVFTEINPNLDGKNFKIEKIAGDKIGDFYPFSGNKVISASYDGFISVIELDFEAQTSKVLSETKVDCEGGEYFRCGAVDPKGCYAAFATKKNGYISRLFFYAINDDFGVELKDVIDYKGTKYCKESSSNLSSLNLDFYNGEFPILAGLQELAQNYLFLYDFDGEKLSEYGDGNLEGYHQNEVMRLRRFENALYSVDEDGVLRRASFE